MDNICRFVRTENSADITIINFVYEKTAEFPQKLVTPAAYSLHAVTSGSGFLHTALGVCEIKEGDLFFTFSAKPYYIENSGGLQYIYISFVGSRAAGLLERVGADVSRAVFGGKFDICERWKNEFFETSDEGMDLAAEGLLLLTLSSLCNSCEESRTEDFDNGILKLKSYTDLNFTDEGLNLISVSERFSYSPKYVSAAFSRLVKRTYSEYLRGLRMEHAKRLFESGMLSVKEAASACGYSDALYFSKVFKEWFGIPPREFIKKCREC